MVYFAVCACVCAAMRFIDIENNANTQIFQYLPHLGTNAHRGVCIVYTRMISHRNAWNVKWTRPTCSTQQKHIIHAPSFISFSSFARSTFASCLWLHIKYCVTSRIFISTCLILCSHKRNINKFYENITFHIRRQMLDICHAIHVLFVNSSTSLLLRVYTSIA